MGGRPAYRRGGHKLRRLSKSRILAGLQCPKRLWLEVHNPELAVITPGLEARFAAGHRLNDVARSLYPGGILIKAETPREALEQTVPVLAGAPDDVVVFEAAVRHEGVFARPDILIRHGGRWRMVEVKSSTSVKPYHLQDTAVQAWVLAGAGLAPERLSVMHIENGFVYAGDGDYHGLLHESDVTDEVAPLMAEVPHWVAEFQRLLGEPMPRIEAGRQCRTPFACPFHDFCTERWPEYHVSLLPRGVGVTELLLAEGYEDLRDVPPGRFSDPLHERVWRVTRSGEPALEPGAAELVRGLAYPRCYLDFETIMFAIPIWRGTRPYQQLPFQWSLHSERADGRLEHAEFLGERVDLVARDGDGPLRAFVESLLVALGEPDTTAQGQVDRLQGSLDDLLDDRSGDARGPILVYTHCEQDRLRELAARFPDLAEPIARVIERIVDLYPVAREYYYHPAMKGSWSIKQVLPTVAPDLDYGALDHVHDGTMAQQAYLELIDKATGEERRARLRAALLAYCAQDTLALVRLARFFATA